jgi:hypothetical protein
MPKQNKSKKWKSILFGKNVTDIFSLFHDNVKVMNNSKLFAGLMIIILNVSSKFVTIKLSKSMEAYLKYTFSRNILIFAIAWMGTRDIYIALIITLLFILSMDYLLNEDSPYCCLPNDFTHYHLNLAESMTTKDDKSTAIHGNNNNSVQSNTTQ